MNIASYISNINKLFQTGNAREHSYRGDLQQLLSALLPEILVTNEPARVACGAPDYVLTKGKNNIPVGYIEAKDIGVKLNSKSLEEQFNRYKQGLSNLIITDYLQFDFYRDGELTTSVTIAEIVHGQIVGKPESYDTFIGLIKNFVQTITQTIRNPEHLAKMLAGKARLMANVIEQSLDADDEAETSSELKRQMLTFQRMLIHDINNKSFADIYAQTIAYGLFAARYNDPTLDTFSRLEAANLIPKSNPFLRKLFQDIAGFDLDDRLVWIVEELVSIFLATDVVKIMKNYGKSTQMEDPIIHFYETFLAEYDKKLREARGVWYTPQPVVNFIVRAVDDILKDEFGLKDGLADTAKTKIKIDTQVEKKRSSGYKQAEVSVHRVQILDPATGTGTFLAETIKHIHKKFKGMEGMWSKYVKQDLIPRLNGFELLMASYAMAHLKMDMLLKETGYNSTDDQRFRIFLTNSLEEAHPDTGTLFSSWLSDESAQANQVKKETPVMVVMGNPPYNGHSKNNSNWINNLMKDYKYEPGTKIKLNERNPKMINNDYIKFIRQAQYFINRNKSGIIAFINPHSFVDSKTMRGFRYNLLETFDKIVIIDLNGELKKKKITIDNKPDENVFDIEQGVSINFFIKNGNNKKLAEVFYKEIIDSRINKYDFLNKNNLKTIDFSKIQLEEPNYNFNNIPLDDKSDLNNYKTYLKIDDIFLFKSTGLQTDKDKFTIEIIKQNIQNKYNDLKNLTTEEIRSKYKIDGDTSAWKLSDAKHDIINNISDINNISLIEYRPFDIRYTYYTGNSNGFMGRPRKDLIQHSSPNNLMLLSIKSSRSSTDWNLIYISKKLITKPTTLTSLDANYAFPLYLYKSNVLELENINNRSPNLNIDSVNDIAEKLGLTFTNEKETIDGTFAPIDILDYIYAVLHSSKYRETYKEFLKIDFPRVPYPNDVKQFWDLVALGKQIREIHLLESPVVDEYISSYPVDGDNIVNKPTYKDGKVYINDSQYFDNVPEIAWNFYIGGYQPAQKWLKDRKDMELSYDDIRHYNKIIVALTETNRLMKEIDKIEFIK